MGKQEKHKKSLKIQKHYVKQIQSLKTIDQKIQYVTKN